MDRRGGKPVRDHEDDVGWTGGAGQASGEAFARFGGEPPAQIGAPQIGLPIAGGGAQQDRFAPVGLDFAGSSSSKMKSRCANSRVENGVRSPVAV
jgi:hypothetical protein